MKDIFTPNNYFKFIVAVSIAATWLSYESAAWNYIEPLVTSLVEFAMTVGVMYFYISQIPVKKSMFMDFVVALGFSFMFVNLVMGAFYTGLCIMYDMPKDGEIADMLSKAYDMYTAVYWFLVMAVFLVTGLFLVVYRTTGENNFAGKK